MISRIVGTCLTVAVAVEARHGFFAEEREGLLQDWKGKLDPDGYLVEVGMEFWFVLPLSGVLDAIVGTVCRRRIETTRRVV